MKLTKKLMALALAMMMAFSYMSMPAMAADEDEGIMPLYEVTNCPECGKDARVTRSYDYDVDFSRDDCPNYPFDHLHHAESTYEVMISCMHCSYADYYITFYGETCPYKI